MTHTPGSGLRCPRQTAVPRTSCHREGRARVNATLHLGLLKDSGFPLKIPSKKKKKVKAMITGYPEKVVRDRAYDVNMPLCTAFKEEKTKQACSSVGLPPPGRGAEHPRLAGEESKGGGRPPGN